MHSFPAMFTLPGRVRPNKYRWLTMFVVLLVLFVIVRPSVSHIHQGCPFLIRSTHGMVWLWWDQTNIALHVPENPGFPTSAQREKRRLYTERDLIPWWQADAIVH
jgi:hypothetical protein